MPRYQDPRPALTDLAGRVGAVGIGVVLLTVHELAARRRMPSPHRVAHVVLALLWDGRYVL